MKKQTIIALGASIASLLLIYFLSISYVPTHAKTKDIGKKVWFTGRIVKVYYHKNGHIFLTLKNKTYVKVVIFSSVAENLGKKLFYLKKGNLLKVLGRLSEYKGKLEIIVSKPSDIIWLGR